MAKKYIDAEKLLDIVIKMRKEYATQEVTEEHKGLKAVLGGQCFLLTEIIRIIDSLQQEQPEVDLEAFRREAAKDIFCAMIHHQNSTESTEVSIAIDIADELIKQLKENKQ